MSISDCNYGLWFDDVSAYRKEGIEKYPDKYKEIDKGRFDEFMELLAGANSFIGNNINEKASEKDVEGERKETSQVVIKLLNVSSPKEVTRMSLLTVFYYYFNIREEEMLWTSYRDLFDVFKSEIDPFLLEAGYQELSAKNIFDVLLTFSSYARNLPV